MAKIESSSIHHFWDTQQHFLKTHFYLESGFLSFLGLQKSPQYQSRDALNTSTQNLADEPTLANGLPWYQSRDALHSSTHNMADEPTMANGPPQYQSRYAFKTSAQKVADEPSLANGPPVPDRDALNTSTQNLADEPTLAIGTPSTRAEMTCILL